MKPQALSIVVHDTVAPLSVENTWSPGTDVPEYTIKLPRNSTIVIRVASIGKLAIDGDLELDPPVYGDYPRIFRWKAASKEAGEGSATITLSHPSDDFEDIEISVDMSEGASLSVDDEQVAAPFTGGDVADYVKLVKRYGAHAVGVLGALGALVFALLMPAYRSELVSAAGAIAFWSFIGTEQYARFFWRAVGFIAAAITMCFAMAIPSEAPGIMSAAGVICAFAIFASNQ